jgi:Rrf2 family iron-sulfur cluster assembly transcriptional regulator
MKLGTRGRYALIAMSQIGRAGPKTHVSLVDIAEAQNISVAYLGQLFANLRSAGLVASVRGPGGGYHLARPAKQIRISEILASVGETVDAMKTGVGVRGGTPSSAEFILTMKLWEGLSAHVHTYLHGLTLADVLDAEIVPCLATQSMIPSA